MRRQPGTAEVPCFTFQLSKGLGKRLLRFSPAFPFSVVEGYSQVVAPRHSAATLGHLFLQDGVVSPIPTSSLSTTSYWVFEAVLRGGRSPIRNPGDALDGPRRASHTSLYCVSKQLQSNVNHHLRAFKLCLSVVFKIFMFIF